MNKPLHVLIIEDSEDDALSLFHELKQGGFDLTFKRVESPDSMSAALDQQEWDIVLSDDGIPRFSVLSALNLLKERGLDLPFIIVSEENTDLTAVSAIKAGAHDDVPKKNLGRLLPAVNRELLEAALRRENREAEEQRRQSQKMEAIGGLAGGIAHDFNNLLTTILSYGQLSLDQMSVENPLRKNIEEIVRSGEKAAALTKQILAFSRRQIVQPKVLDLNTIVTGMDESLRRLVGEKIELAFSLEPELEYVKIDPVQIEQMIMDLAVNALDAMPQQGRLTIATASTKPDGIYSRRHEDLLPGQYVKLTVSDTGTGIDSEIISRIFDPFFTTKGTGDGAGLGLSTVYGIVKQNNGHIRVDSRKDHGTTFEIYLLCVDEAVETLAPVRPASQQSNTGETILVVEDEDAVRELICKVLKAHGHTVLEAPHGVEALQVVEKHEGTIQLMVTDVVMPRMSGRDLARRLAPLCPEMKVLYISGYTEDEIVHNSILDEDTEFLQKPFMPNVLLNKVREVLNIS
jgi:two-component system cell cycle sensor histidine kinase/response regulator CckA